jgi:hypothetical protein
MYLGLMEAAELHKGVRDTMLQYFSELDHMTKAKVIAWNTSLVR